jgi:2-hydroxy-3-keto-5-methylthiopentenyl-1-phosphate phosphatase
MACMALQLSIFCDFDGTITTVDTGDEFFAEFSTVFDDSMARLMSGKSSVRDYYHDVVRGLRPLSSEMVQDFALRYPIDAYFADFVKYCHELSFPLTIVSDGFKEYIEPILAANDMSEVQYYSNAMQEVNGQLSPLFPNATESCSCFCASCKRNIVLNNTPPDTLIVYIGDGYSDMCAASHADIIFAKGALASYCATERIPHYPFRTFFDIIRLMKNGLEQKKFRPRHQAVLLRKKAYEIE